MWLRSDAGLLAEEYNPKTNGLMGSFPPPFSHVTLETTAVDIIRQKACRPAIEIGRFTQAYSGCRPRTSVDCIWNETKR
jgi:hypothetical protein